MSGPFNAGVLRRIAWRLAGLASAFACALAMLAACTSTAPQDTSLPALRAVASQPAACTEISESCAKEYIQHGSACAQLTNTGSADKGRASRQCAETNYDAALAHLPASGSDDMRTQALIGLADSLKALRDNTATPGERAQVQQKLDTTIAKLAQQRDGQVYAQDFRADSMVASARSQALAPADACARLRDARAGLPAASSDAALQTRINRLKNAIDTYLQQRSCP